MTSDISAAVEDRLTAADYAHAAVGERGVGGRRLSTGKLAGAGERGDSPEGPDP
jgi:hypothetical protein